jgi:methylmalonyl-CoA mutase N-terminal domain/subunit
MAKVESLGGAAAAIAAGFFQDEIARSAYEFQMRVERGETVIVGVNRFANGEEAPPVPAPDYSLLEAEQVKRLAAVRRRRDRPAVERALAEIGAAATAYAGEGRAERPELMPLIVDAVRARATVGEISDVLAACWGMYRPG